MTPQELIDAVRPCLPLPGIDRVARGKYGNVLIYVGMDDEEGPTCDTMRYESQATAIVIGAIAQACDERGWSVHTMMNGVRCVTIYGPLHENDSGVRKLGEADGRGVLAWCRAYAQAKEATK